MSTTATVVIDGGSDNERSSGLSGLVPAPIASNTPAPSTQTGSSGLPEGESGSTNLIYIYSFLSTLFILLCIAILVLLRALVRRRRLDLLFNQVGESSNDAAQDAEQRQQRQRRQKKRQHLGSKPLMSEVWIGSGPVSPSESTEALLQPFSVSRAPANENEKKPFAREIAAAPLTFDATVEQQQEAVERKSPYPLQVSSFCPLPSSSSCTFDNNEKLGTVAGGSDTGHTSIGHWQSPISPSIPITASMPLEPLCVGVFIAMPRPRAGKEGSARWDEHLCEGEIPELSVGISTVYAPVDSSLVTTEQDIKAEEEPVSAEHAPTRERRRRRRRHIPIPPHMTDYP